MFLFRELFILMFLFGVLDTKNRTKRNDINALIAGRLAGKPNKPVKTMVAIMYLDHNGHNKPVCSGTVIGNTWVVSAGHCFPDDSPLVNTTAVAGEMNLEAYYGKYSITAKTVNLVKVYKPQNYMHIPKKVLDNDLALVKLAESLELSSNANIKAAYLPPPGMKITGEEFQVVGWGRQGKLSPMSPALLSIEITVNQDQDCRATHRETRYFPCRMFCGGTKDETTCNGDSGGGGISHIFGVPVIVGVVSFSKDNEEEKCQTSAIYTKLEVFLPWIFQLTKIKPLDVFADDGYYEKYLDNFFPVVRFSDDNKKLIITNDERSNDYIQISFKNQKDEMCTTKELNSFSQLKKLRVHKYPYDVVQSCFFQPEDVIQFRLKTQMTRGRLDYDELCLTSVKLVLPLVTFIAKQRTCAEQTGEWITMQASPYHPLPCG